MGKKKESLEEMKGEALRRQDNLAADIDELLDRINPVNAIQRWKNEATDSAKSFSSPIAAPSSPHRSRASSVALSAFSRSPLARLSS